MGWFRKRRGEDVIDLTDLYKRGLLKSQEVTEESTSDGDLVDFSSSGGVGGGESSSSSGSEGASALGFLSNLAGAGSSAGESSDPSYGSYTNKLKEARRSNLAEFNTMRIKLEDLEYKLDRFIERIDKMEEKLGKA